MGSKVTVGIKLVGGLGNQMFQYCAGRAISLQLDTDLYIDRGAYSTYKLHAYGLKHFTLKVDDLPKNLIPLDVAYPVLAKLLPIRPSTRRLRRYVESGFHFDATIFGLNEDVYLEGYWQSDRYFSDYESVIRDDFRFLTPPTKKTDVWLQKIRNCTSVSLHVRRGDYVSSRLANQFHGTCSLEYYVQAIRRVHEIAGRAVVFFVFSDDPGWARENLSFDDCPHYFITDNDADKNYEDLRLMSACQHNIIANSTFSWWGAWLNPNPNKIVIAPIRWFIAEGISTDDLIPESWERI